MECIKLGYQFSSLDEVYAALKEYKKNTEVEFIIRDCRRLGTEKLKNKDCLHANEALIYYYVKFCCVRGGRHFLPRGTGARKRRTWKTGCPAHMLLTISDCRQYLQVKQLVLEHNHKVVPRPLKRTEARAERRRFRIMHRLKISYEEAKKIDMINKSIKRNGTMKTEGMVSKGEIDSNDNKTLLEDYDSFSPEEDFPLTEPYFKPKIDNCYYKAVSYMNSNTNLMKKMYKTDDEGSPGNSLWTATFNGKRKFKDDSILETLGTIEELSSSIGFAIEFLPDVCQRICYELREIQGVLQEMVIHVGSPKSCNSNQMDSCPFPNSYVTKLENVIDYDKAVLPESKHHIVPSGGKCSSALHVARSVCRRAERRVVGLVREQEVDETTVKYLNRLGDYLFIAARMVCISSNNEEHLYKKSESMTVDNEELPYEEPELQEDKMDNFEVVYLSHSSR